MRASDLWRRGRTLGLLAATALAALGAAPARAGGCTLPFDGLVVTSDVAICPGVYFLSDPGKDGVIRVQASGVTVDLTGVTLVGGNDGWGVVADGVDDVTIVGGTLSGYRGAVFLQHGSGHHVRDGVYSFNRKRPVTNSPGDFLAVWPDFPGQLAADQIGNGVVLVDVHDTVVEGCELREQQNGLGLFECSGVQVLGNDCSDNEGWGIHLHRSSDNLIAGNRADNCFNKLSTYCHTVQQDGCDTAALLVIKASNRNRVVGNELRNSGDGVFSAAQEGATHWGADHNHYVGNDCRFAKHIGLESTFSQHNAFVRNDASHAGRYGFWLGYSRDVLVRRNRVVGNATAGISNESVLRARYEENLIAQNPIGVDLRRGSFFALDQESRDHRFVRNVIQGNAQRGLALVDTHELRAFRNVIAGNAGGNVFLGAAKEVDIQGPLRIQENHLLGGAAFNVWNQQPTPVDLTRNWWGTTDPAAIAATIRGLDQYAVIPPHRLPRLEVDFQLGADGPYLLRRVVNERAADAFDLEGAAPAAWGSGLDHVALGGEPGAPAVAGFVFRDVYLPGDATVLGARLVLPTDAGAAPLALRLHAQAADDARPFGVGDGPSQRPRSAASVAWSPAGPWSAGGWATSPDVAALVVEVLARPGWTSGASLALLVVGESSGGTRAVQSFDRDGYASLPMTPYEFRRYRKHRFAKLEAELAEGALGLHALERELGGSADDADDCVGCNEVHVGFLNGPKTDGFRFPDLAAPPSVAIASARLWIPTDGTYTNPIALALWGELLLAPPPYSATSLPLGRPRTLQSVPWSITNTWTFLQWHPTPDIAPLLEEVRAQPGWSPGNPVAVDFTNAGSAGHRRVWAFDRDPRILQSDFPQIGPTPFVPFLRGPLDL